LFWLNLFSYFSFFQKGRNSSNSRNERLLAERWQKAKRKSIFELKGVSNFAKLESQKKVKADLFF
jgi:hypothetical protein